MTTREDKSFLKQQEVLLMLYSAIGAQRKGNSWRDDLKVVLLKASVLSAGDSAAYSKEHRI